MAFIRCRFLICILTLLIVAGCKAEQGVSSPPDVPKESEQESEKPSKNNLVDINTASKSDLISLPGIGEVYAQKIMDGRPYKMKSQLKSRNIIPDATYEIIVDRIIATQHK